MDNDISICTLCCHSYHKFFEAFITIPVLFGFLKQSALMQILERVRNVPYSF